MDAAFDMLVSLRMGPSHLFLLGCPGGAAALKELPPFGLPQMEKNQLIKQWDNCAAAN